jgi:hypothetical protein
MEAYRKHVQAFRNKFGREMRPDDPFFFDPHAPAPELRSPEEVRFAMDFLVGLMVEVGIDPSAIYAFKSTGGLFPDAAAPFSPSQQSEWNAALQEYEDRLCRLRKQ